MTRNPVPSPAQSGDDLDQTLRAFFQAQMPNPWPKAPAPTVSLRPFRARRSRLALLRSRAALAASVALLIFGSWWLVGQTSPLSPDSAPILPDNGQARNNTLFPSSSHKRPHSGRPQRATPEREMDPVKILDPMDLPPMK